MSRPPLTVVLAEPRGFCAGVTYAIEHVERALAVHGAPVYVRHEIVHNRFVVEGLKAKGAIFVNELDEVPDDAPVIFSAHGVPRSVPAEADRRGLEYLDATCPLVSKVHRGAERQYAAGRHVLLIGHAGHPEVIGTMGQLPEGAMTLVETVADAEAVTVPDPEAVAYCTQTTLAADETADILRVLARRFPALAGPQREDLCYATTNRQKAVRGMAGRVDLVLVLGAPNSSNSRRLVEVAERAGAPRARLLGRADELSDALVEGVSAVGITAGASAPEVLVSEVIDHLRTRFEVTVETVRVAEEHLSFRLPRALREAG